jgi:hypothetical protein
MDFHILQCLVIAAEMIPFLSYIRILFFQPKFNT